MRLTLFSLLASTICFLPGTQLYSQANTDSVLVSISASDYRQYYVIESDGRMIDTIQNAPESLVLVDQYVYKNTVVYIAKSDRYYFYRKFIKNESENQWKAGEFLTIEVETRDVKNPLFGKSIVLKLLDFETIVKEVDGQRQIIKVSELERQ